ncbi:hypothetical protein HD806DRAFT_495993 [Xylariaceae sp. AK1471]|nr:hypothetical protein HD806DRAFT_495993 [Xylariaceae sp. AK1471]
MDKNLRSVLQNTINTFVSNNTLAVKTKDTSLLSAILTPDCIRLYRPLSIINRYPAFFKPRLTNADYEAQMEHELRTMQDVSQEITSTIIDTAERKAVIWTEQTVYTINGSKNFVEVVWNLDFNEDGTRVKQILEFIDTAESIKVVEQMLSTKVDAE